MKTKCPKCKGRGSVVVDYKECDACGGDLILRDDDKPETVKARSKFLMIVLIVMEQVRLMFVGTVEN